MTLPTLRALLTPRRPSKSTTRHLTRAAAMTIESLEHRTLMSTVIVNTLADTNNAPNSGIISLRDAIIAADGNSGPDTITFAPSLTAAGPATITLTQGAISLNDTAGLTTITGPGQSLLSISGNNASRIFTVRNSALVTLTDLTFTDGNESTVGGAISNAGTLTLISCSFTDNTATSNSGAIYSGSSMSISDCSFTGNTSRAGFGGIITNAQGTMTITNSSFAQGSAFQGGAIYASAPIDLTNCTFTSNSASYGGAILNNNTMTLTNCTLSGNSATQSGGAIYNQDTLTISNSTITGNSADLVPNSTGGVEGNGLTLHNNIIAGNTGTNPDLHGTIDTSSSYNLIGDGSTAFNLTNDVNGNQLGTDVAPIDPHLAPLGNYGGPTQTMPLLSGSPAIDVGDPNFDPPPTTDQRGFARIANGHLDMGAVETQKVHFVLTPNAPGPVLTGTTVHYSLSGLDEFGQPALAYAGSVHFTSSDPAATLPANATFANVPTGTFDVTYNTPGNQTLTITDTLDSSITGTSAAMHVNLPNQAPTALALTGNTVQENQPIGTTVGTLSSTDPDAGNTFTYTLVSGTGSTDNARFSITGNTLKTASVFTSPAPATFSVRVRTTDQGGLFAEQIITITESDLAPTDLTLTGSTIPAKAGAGATVGTLATTDPDPNDTFTYTLVAGAGDTDNARFTLTGSTLKTAAPITDAAPTTYSIRVRTTDQAGLFTEKTLTLTNTPTARLAFVHAPTKVVAGAALSPAVTVHLLSAAGVVQTKDTSKVTLKILSGPKGGKIIGGQATAAKKGLVTFGKISFTVAGTYVLRATDDAYAAATISLTVVPAAPKKLVFSQVPSSVHASQAFAVRLTAYDQYGNLATNDQQSITLALDKKATGGLLHGTVKGKLTAGSILFQNLSLTPAGQYSLKATSGRLLAQSKGSIKVR